MNLNEVIKSQYRASLDMLSQAISKCPPEAWDDKSYRNRFWHVAYHALFYTHLYLQPSDDAFIPWEKHKDDYQFMGPVPWPPHNEPDIGEPYRKEEVLEYLAVCQQQIENTVDSINWEDKSGFSWLPFSKMELQFYNIRHLQQHIGELSERLGAEYNIDVDWTGMKV